MPMTYIIRNYWLGRRDDSEEGVPGPGGQQGNRSQRGRSFNLLLFLFSPSIHVHYSTIITGLITFEYILYYNFVYETRIV